MTSTHYLDKLETNTDAREAIENIKQLIENGTFHIKLDMVTGASQPDKDKDLLKRLRSRGKDQRAEAILDFLYSIRCNMFHGQKSFHEVQIQLLIPACAILRSTAEILFEKLARDEG
jgi:hypothetical protein